MSLKVDIEELVKEIFKEASSRNINIRLIQNKDNDNLDKYNFINIKHIAPKFPNQELGLKTTKELFNEMNTPTNIEIEFKLINGQIGVWGSYFLAWKPFVFKAL